MATTKRTLPIAARFGQHLGYRLSDVPEGKDVISVNTWRMRQELVRVLATNRDYLFGLIGIAEMGMAPPPRDAEFFPGDQDGIFMDAFNAAEMWMDAVLDGPRDLHASKPMHKAHELLEDICGRGHQWPDIELRRSHDLPGDEEPPVSVAGTMDRLARLVRAASEPASPSPAKKNHGPLWLIVEGAAAEVPDSLSIWGAVQAGPARLDPLPKDSADQLLFAGMVGEAVNGAAKQWIYLKQLGLSPPDWIDPDPESGAETPPLHYLATNQAANALKWQRVVGELAEAAGRAEPGPADYEAAWDARPIKKMTYAEFTETRAGQALLNIPPKPPASFVDIDDGPEIAAEDMASVEDEMIEEVFDALTQDPQFTKTDIAILRVVIERFTADDIYSKVPLFAEAFGDIASFQDHVAELQDRFYAAILGLNGS